MLFNSFDFILFLPIVFLLYWFVFKTVKSQNCLIVAASYVFYGLWDWRFLFLIAFTTLCSYVSGVLIEKNLDKEGGHAKAFCITNIVVNLLILCIFKYYNFFVGSFVDLMSLFKVKMHASTLEIILPVGISFYTFQAIGYSIDVYKRRVEASHDVISFFAFICFFPQLVAGPIERAANLLPQFCKERVFEYNKAADGMRQILWGLFKKIVIADNCAEFVDYAFKNYQETNGATLALAGIFFALQIYGDFSGYSDIAIGTGKLFGITLRDNFRTPYFSRDVAEFWKRWHISLNKWFVDYVYIPLGGSRTTNIKVVRNVFVIFLLSGLWHGANWTYVAWGAYHALLFVPLILLKQNKRNSGIIAENTWYPKPQELGGMLLTFVLVSIGWIIFRADNIGAAFEILKKIFTFASWKTPKLSIMTYQTPTLIAIGVCLAVEWINRKRAHSFDFSWIKFSWIRIPLYYIIFAMIVLYSGENHTFIYFQF